MVPGPYERYDPKRRDESAFFNSLLGVRDDDAERCAVQGS